MFPSEGPIARLSFKSIESAREWRDDLCHGKDISGVFGNVYLLLAVRAPAHLDVDERIAGLPLLTRGGLFRRIDLCFDPLDVPNCDRTGIDFDQAFGL